MEENNQIHTSHAPSQSISLQMQESAIVSIKSSLRLQGCVLEVGNGRSAARASPFDRQ
jgi:phosphoheptose isomerase